MITKLAFIRLQDDMITCGSKVGKNLQFIGNISEASTFGTPGRCRTLHISNNGLLHARLHNSYRIITIEWQRFDNKNNKQIQ